MSAVGSLMEFHCGAIVVVAMVVVVVVTAFCNHLEITIPFPAIQVIRVMVELIAFCSVRLSFTVSMLLKLFAKDVS